MGCEEQRSQGRIYEKGREDVLKNSSGLRREADGVLVMVTISDRCKVSLRSYRTHTFILD